MNCNPEAVEHLLGAQRMTGLKNVAAVIDSAISMHIQELDGRKSLQIATCPDGSGKWLSMNKTFEAPKWILCPILEWSILDQGKNIKEQYVVSLSALFGHVSPQSYTVYYHAFGRTDEEMKVYIGVTRQGWTARYRQHLNAANNGSPYLFHRALRAREVDHVTRHEILGSNLSLEEAMNLEEELVVRWGGLYPLHPNGLNMIPGGFAGIKYLHRLGIKNINPRRWEHRSALIRQSIKLSAKLGQPNFLAQIRWQSDAYASATITANPNNYTIEEVRRARSLSSMGLSSQQIADTMKCRLDRVNRLLKGKTYSRVH